MGCMAGRRHRATLTDLSCEREPRANSHSNAGEFYNPRFICLHYYMLPLLNFTSFYIDLELLFLVNGNDVLLEKLALSNYNI